jgi:hypothetical protein
MDVMKKISLAITRNPKLFASSIFFGMTSFWAFLEPFVSVCFTNINKYWFLLFFIPPSLIIALIKTFPKKSISIELKNTNTVIHIKFGNLFEQEGVIAIAVNDYFDSEIGKPVSEKSIHGFFIMNILGGKYEIFDEGVDKSLSNVAFIEQSRDLGKTKKYPIGSTACIEFGGKKYLMFAMSKTNNLYEAHTNPSLLFEALEGLLAKARSECNGHDFNLPLIGTGMSRSGIPTKYIIELLLISILTITKQSEITKHINIIIEASKFEQIDLNEIKRKWS